MTQENGQRLLYFTQPPQRVVSLVPSITESLFDLGLGSTVVGVTDYCLHPAGQVRDLPHVGGPKNPHIGEIEALHPDLVCANMEENTRQTVEALESLGLAVWVTFPKTVRQALDVLWRLVGVFQDKPAAIRLETLEFTLEWAESSLETRQPWHYFCPIWQHIPSGEGNPWWMTFNQETYCNDVLRLMGGRNIFAQRARRYPLEADLGQGEAEAAGERDTRYPRLSLDEIRSAQPDVILLPSEPFAFDEAARQALCEYLVDTPAVRNGRVHSFDGSLITWHGTRLARALRELPDVLGE